MMDSALPLLIGLALVVILTVARAIRAPARGKERLVEKPNSHYTARAVREVEVQHRWNEIVLDRVHEINRAEVVRLLAKARAAGVSLAPREREFLEQMAEIAGAPKATKGPKPPSTSQDAGGP